MNERELVNYYNKFNEDKRLSRRHGIVEFETAIKYINMYLNNFKDAKILDVGAGTGRYSMYFSNLGYDVTAVELVKHNLRVLEKNCPSVKSYLGNAIEICDFCLGKIYEKAKEHFYELIITADHGNAEKMLNRDKTPITSHTTSKVPFIICNDEIKLKPEGTLIDIAPTIIDLYEIKKPDVMTGESLIIKETE